MYWNHRIINCPSENGGDTWLTIKEVFYDEYDKGDHTPYAYTDACFGGESIEEMQQLVERFAVASALPVLHEDYFKLHEIKE